MPKQKRENEMPAGEIDTTDQSEQENMGDAFRATARTSPTATMGATGSPEETLTPEAENMGDVFRATATTAIAESVREKPSEHVLDASHTGKMPGEEETTLTGQIGKMPGE